MELHTSGTNPEHFNTRNVSRPASELLLDYELARTAWPYESSSYPEFLTQIDERSMQSALINDVISQIPSPTMAVDEAVEQGHVSEMQAGDLYDNLAAVLGNDDYMRLALYLPLELLPDSGWVPETNDLSDAINCFKQSYMRAWYSLLTVQDVRANFVDGDVLEPELRTGDLPRVIKAVHLIPTLVARGLISLDHIQELLSTSDDPLLKQNLKDMLDVIAGTEQTSQIEPQRRSEGVITERRQAWLDQKTINEAIETQSERLISELTEHPDAYESLSGLLTSTNMTSVLVGIEAVRKIVLQSEDPLSKYKLYEPLLVGLWQAPDQDIKERLTKSFRHFFRQGIMDNESVTSLGVQLPNPAGLLSENMRLIPTEIEQLKNVAHRIEADPWISRYVYPVIAFGGSKLKGYGEESSDIDTCIFIRPNTAEDTKKQLRLRLKAIFEAEGQLEEPIEFWLEEAGEHLSVRRSEEGDSHTADAYWTHLLFNAAWIGSLANTNTLRETLLSSYFYTTEARELDMSERKLYLERMEQDALQYRLLHKGYAKHYPPHSTKGLPQSAAIDSQSVFWDAGYRRLATKLFLERVFLPKL